MAHSNRISGLTLLLVAFVVVPFGLSASDIPPAPAPAPERATTGIDPVTLDPGESQPAGPRSDAGEHAPVPHDLSTPDDPRAPEDRIPEAVPDPVRSIIIPDQRPVPTVEELAVESRWPAEARASGGVLAHRQVIAYYGHPNSRRMGVLGETPIEEMTEKLRARAAEYDALTGGIGVAPAFHIIFATVHPDATVGVIREAQLLEYIEFAAENDLLVFLDHQIGSGTVEWAMRKMLPYLRYPHVHLAFDPEWATDMPAQVIGGVTADDVNLAQQMIQEYLIEHGLPGPRMLVVHQFNWRMIIDRERVRADFPLVQLIHHADGWGSPAQKRDSWRFNNIATNIPLKGFKLFYPKTWRDGGYDVPLMTPADVLQLEPVPVYIQYQ
jgi:hypothetical protein